MTNYFRKMVLFPYTFVLMNWAPVAGLYEYLRGHADGVWKPVPVKHALEKMS